MRTVIRTDCPACKAKLNAGVEVEVFEETVRWGLSLMLGKAEKP